MLHLFASCSILNVLNANSLEGQLWNKITGTVRGGGASSRGPQKPHFKNFTLLLIYQRTFWHLPFLGWQLTEQSSFWSLHGQNLMHLATHMQVSSFWVLFLALGLLKPWFRSGAAAAGACWTACTASAGTSTTGSGTACLGSVFFFVFFLGAVFLGAVFFRGAGSFGCGTSGLGTSCCGISVSVTFKGWHPKLSSLSLFSWP